MSMMNTNLLKRLCNRISVISACSFGPVNRQSVKDHSDDDLAEASKTTRIFNPFLLRITIAW